MRAPLLDHDDSFRFPGSALGQIRKVERDGSESTLATIVPPGSGLGPLGLAVDAPGNVYAAVATFDPSTSGVYRIVRDGSIAQNTIARVSPGGVVTAFATAADGLDFRRASCSGRTTTCGRSTFAIGPPGGPGPALLRFAAGVKGQPLP